MRSRALPKAAPSTSPNEQYETPFFEPTGLLACHPVGLRPSIWERVWDALQLLGNADQWRQDDISHATIEQVITEVNAAVDAAVIGGASVIGSCLPFAGALPTGVLPCDGSQYLRINYPLLYAALDPAFIVDADNFVTPDLRGRAVIGVGSGPGLSTRTMDDEGGEETHVLTLPETPAHVHSVPAEGTVAGYLGETPALVLADTLVGSTGSAGGGAAHNTMSPFRALRWGILATPCCTGAGGPGTEIAILADVKDANVAGGTFTTGAWQIRPLNTWFRAAAWASLNANRVTLAAGTYKVRATAPAYRVNQHQVAYYDVLSALRQPGQSAVAAQVDNSMTPSEVTAWVQSVGNHAFEIHHRCQTSKATDGYGLPAAWGQMVYTIVVIEKIA